MKITSVAIKGLFGCFDYSIEMEQDTTIIYGQNGCGKTTILKMIDAVFHVDIAYLLTVEFVEIVFHIDRTTVLTVMRKQYGSGSAFNLNDEKPSHYVCYELKLIQGKSSKPIVFDPLNNVDLENMMGFDKRKGIPHRRLLPPYFERIADKWVNSRSGEVLSDDEISEYMSEVYLNRLVRNGNYSEMMPEPLQQALKEIDVRIITADRLLVQTKKIRPTSYSNDEQTIIEKRVEIFASDISTRIKKAIQDYALLSQSYDRTFPIRVIQTAKELEIIEIKDRLVRLEDKRKQLIDSGILGKEESININDLVDAVSESSRKTLSLYAEDTEIKLNMFSDLANSISIFRSLIEKNFLNKRILFDKDFGFQFETTNTKRILKPKDLSSGEQHELVIFYDLVFNTNDKTLVLIDEPELSLNIKWQSDFLDDLHKIIQTTGFSALIATHSPQIIRDRWELTRALTSEGK